MTLTPSNSRSPAGLLVRRKWLTADMKRPIFDADVEVADDHLNGSAIGKEQHAARQIVPDDPSAALALDDVSLGRVVAKALGRNLRRLRRGAETLFLAQHFERELQPLVFDRLRRTL